MPVYNGENYLHEAIESILNQTYKDIEFLIINDGSTDRSVEIIESYTDPRIRLVNNDKNFKLVATLNRGLELSSGEYVARMDQDDISLPLRLEKQVAFMDSNPEVGVCGTWIKTIGTVRSQIWRYETVPDVINCSMIFNSAVAHPSVMMRKALFEKYDLKYDDNYPHAEDLQLWQRASLLFPFVNLNEILVLYRLSTQRASHVNSVAQMEIHRQICSEAIEHLHITPNPSELNIHCRLSMHDYDNDRNFLELTERWLLKLQDANRKANRYPHTAFNKVLGIKWYDVCLNTSNLSLWPMRKFSTSPLGRLAGLNYFQKISFAAKCGVKYMANYLHVNGNALE